MAWRGSGFRTSPMGRRGVRRSGLALAGAIIALGLYKTVLAQGSGPRFDVTPVPLRGTWRIAEIILPPIGKYAMDEVAHFKGKRVTIGPDTIDFFGSHCAITEVHTVTYLRGRDEEWWFVGKWGPLYPCTAPGPWTQVCVMRRP